MKLLLTGKEVAQQINEKNIAIVQRLKAQGKDVTLAIVRIGEDASDIQYESSAIKKCNDSDVKVKSVVLTSDISEEEYLKEIDKLNADNNIDGILLLRPLPKHINDKRVRDRLVVNKDVDGCCDESLAGIFTNNKDCFAPCTAQAVIEMLNYYHIDVCGKKVVVVGRSLVIGKPVAMLLLALNATVTIAHSKSTDLQEIVKNADIVITSVGKAEMFDGSYFRTGQVVIDVGVNYSESKQKMVGDVDFDTVSNVVDMISPVPRGVGSITTSVLINHVCLAAERK